jgi:hypothetical protein
MYADWPQCRAGRQAAASYSSQRPHRGRSPLGAKVEAVYVASFTNCQIGLQRGGRRPRPHWDSP